MTTKVIPYPVTPLKDGWTAVDKDRVTEGAPRQVFKVFYTSKSEELSSGIWQCTIGKWRVSYSEDEFCTLIEGHVRLTNDKRETQEFKAPACFMIPAGYKGLWEALTPVKKFFVIYEKSK
jgi:uncharacterized cupin superfamily protein